MEGGRYRRTDVAVVLIIQAPRCASLDQPTGSESGESWLLWRCSARVAQALIPLQGALLCRLLCFSCPTRVRLRGLTQPVVLSGGRSRGCQRGPKGSRFKALGRYPLNNEIYTREARGGIQTPKFNRLEHAGLSVVLMQEAANSLPAWRWHRQPNRRRKLSRIATHDRYVKSRPSPGHHWVDRVAFRSQQTGRTLKFVPLLLIAL